ncbi:glycosyltransferase family 4 protein [Frankia sp. B2]|uniref:glycosyltransferase family 4 protein n=1 Tax=unclassified Frankia TaxID=2632575 RepID=UPI00046110D7|nr:MULTISPECIES: glycosyltransferase family 4 protein [unclassified Frankia]KDA40607.1 glycosyltransferase [Frankia sp. BMG5.23]TFE28327.1 glycosyltransferase family 4 protein [Frankia sp. B2]
MRIAQVAPLWEPVPPARYGAVESLVASLSQELTRRGHDVTVFASGDSTPAGRLVAVHPRSLNADSVVVEPEAIRLAQMVEVLSRADEFDIIHSHLHSNSGLLGAVALREIRSKTLHTVHCYVNADNRRLLSSVIDNKYVAISDYQRLSDPSVGWYSRVRHGLDIDEFPFRGQPESPPYVAFLGRLRPEKRPHFAIEAALSAGIQIRIAGRIKPADREFFAREISPRIDGEKVQYLGELGFSDKVRLLGGARATVITSILPEPFGLVAIESMACGTPIVGTQSGAAPEVVRNGEGGLIAGCDDSFPGLLSEVTEVDREGCRRLAAELYSLGRMTNEYEKLYRAVLTASR